MFDKMLLSIIRAAMMNNILDVGWFSSNGRPIPRKINQRKLRKRIRQGCVVRQ